MTKYAILVLLLCVRVSFSYSQTFSKSTPVTGSFTYVEPDGRTYSCKIDDTSFIHLVKTQGGAGGESVYSFVEMNQDMKVRFCRSIPCPENTEIKDIYYNQKNIILLIEKRDVANKKATFYIQSLDSKEGNLIAEKKIVEYNVNNWQNKNEKGKVKQSFEMAVSSCLSPKYVTPLQYKFYINYSPDRNKILVYFYDYSQTRLMTNFIILDQDMNILQNSSVPIDEGFVNHGVYINNKADIYILNENSSGRVNVVKYAPSTKEASTLDVSSSTVQKHSLKLYIWKDNIIYLCAATYKGEKLEGAMYVKMNFEAGLIDKLVYYQLTDNLHQTVIALREAEKYVPDQEDWKNYIITHFEVNPYEKVIILMEKKDVQSIEFPYKIDATNDPAQWKERIGKVSSETVLAISFNAKEDLLWENAIVKSQSNDVIVGNVTSSYSHYITAEGKIRFIYPEYQNSSGTYNMIHFIEYDELSGAREKKQWLDNADEVGVLTPYTVWWDDRMVTMGRKGLLGKKGNLLMYKF